MRNSAPVSVTRSERSRQQGLTLIEALITLVLISVGLLGAAAFHINTLREVQYVYQRSQAIALAEDIAGRMQASRAQVATFLFDSQAAQANVELNAWRNRALALPSGRVIVAQVGANPLYQIRVFWDEDRDGDAGTGGCDPAARNANDLDCYQLLLELQ